MVDKKTDEPIISSVVHESDPKQIQATYRDWSSNYNQDVERFGYVAPQTAVAQLQKLLSGRQALIYDAGCGTGLAGKLLAKAGYRNLHGADFSPEMLRKARATGVYSQLDLADYSAPISVADQVYSAVISVGVYCAGFRSHFLDEMLRILKPQGVLYFTCRSHFYEKGVDQDLLRLNERGKLTDLSVELLPSLTTNNTDAYYISARKLG